MATPEQYGNWCWGGGATHGLAVRFAGVNFKGSFTSRCVLVTLQSLLFVGLLVTGFILYGTSTYWTTKAYPLLYDYNSDGGLSHSRFLDWNAALAFGVLGAIGVVGSIWEYLSVCSSTVHPVERVSTRWSTVLIDSFITPVIVVTLLIEVGDLSIWNLISIFFLHHISSLVNYMIEYDGQTKTSKTRLNFDKNIGLFVSLVAALPIFFAWPRIQTLNNTVISAATIVLFYGVFDCLVNYMYASALCTASMPGNEWFKMANDKSRQALVEQANMDSSGLLVSSATPRIEDDREEVYAVIPTHAKNITTYYRYFMIKSTVAPIFKFTAALLLLLAPVTDTSARRQEMSRVYSDLCGSDAPPSSWQAYGFERDSCMLNGVLCNYLGDMDYKTPYNAYEVDFVFNKNPYQTFGVDKQAFIGVTDSYPADLMYSSGDKWTSLLNNNNVLGNGGMIFGNSTAYFLCRGTDVSGCNGVSKCPSIGWSEDRRASSDISITKSGAVLRAIGPAAVPMSGTYTMTPSPTPTSRNGQKLAFMPINCELESGPGYVGIKRSTASLCIASGWGSAGNKCPCPGDNSKTKINAGDPSEGWIDDTCTYDIRCSTGLYAPNY